VAAARELGHSVALWALDEKVPSLAAFTVGVGAGLRMDLLNRLWDVARADAPAQVVVADDDVSFARGSLAQLLGAASVCGFGIAQPARRRDGDFSHEITRERALMLARQTTFVEIGPLFVVSGAWIPKVLPFPEGFGMGWGLELLWQELHRDGCGLGVVDCVSVDHPGRAGSREYDAGPEGERLRSMLQERKLESTAEGQRTLRSWHVWQARPPWSALDAPADLEGAR
jgi:hypothetical protein